MKDKQLPQKHPRATSEFTSKGKKKVKFMGYVNWQLTAQHKVAYQAWVEEGHDLDQLVERVLETEHDLKVRYDEYNQCFAAQLYCRGAENDNAGWCLSMRAISYWEAIRRLLWVHLIALEESWATDADAGWSDDNW